MVTVIGMMRQLRTHFLWRPQLCDPNAELVRDAAVNGRARILITFNTDDFAEASARRAEGLAP